MKSPLEWIREGKPGYAEKKKKAELETRLAALKDALAEITVDAGSAAAHLDARIRQEFGGCEAEG